MLKLKDTLAKTSCQSWETGQFPNLSVFQQVKLGKQCQVNAERLNFEHKS